MTTPATQLAAVAAFLADFPDLEPMSVRYDSDRGTEVHVYIDDLPDWLDALDTLPPGDDDWEPFGATDRLAFTIPATEDRPFSVFTLAAKQVSA